MWLLVLSCFLVLSSCCWVQRACSANITVSVFVPAYASSSSISEVFERVGCYSQLKGSEGYLVSPNYPHDYPRGFDCYYDLLRPSPKYCGVKLQAEEFRVFRGGEDSASLCQSDWLAMESCVPLGDSRHCGDQTGTTYQHLFQPGASAIRFHFHSSSNRSRTRSLEVGGSGYRYRLHYRMLQKCSDLFVESPQNTETLCYTRITDRSGTINTPYHPKQYPANVDCVYEFIRPNPLICGIKMRSLSFQLEPASESSFEDACSDFFQAPGCGFLCGDINFSWTALYQPGATSQKFHFHSDEVNNLSGFMIEFEQSYHC